MSVISGRLQNCEVQKGAIAKKSAYMSMDCTVGEGKEARGFVMGIPEVEELTVRDSED